MTVAELIAELQKLPQDYPVAAYSAFEDTHALTTEGIRVWADGASEWWDSNDMLREDAYVEIIGG